MSHAGIRVTLKMFREFEGDFVNGVIDLRRERGF
jgi:hypothetical protein